MKPSADPVAFAFEPVQPPTLKDRVAAEIRRAILRGDLTPGARIVESALAKQMRVAQTTVREAMVELEKQGLVVKYVNRETLVRRLLPGDVKKLHRARVALEGLAVELAHARATEQRLRPLYGIVEDMVQAAARRDFPEFYRLDLKFHRELWRLSNNEFLERALSTLSVGPFAFVLAGFPAPLDVDYVEVARDHARILDALRKPTARAARKVMEERLEGWHRMQLGLFEKQGTQEAAVAEHPALPRRAARRLPF